MAASFQDHFHMLDTATPGEETEDGEWRGMAPDLRPRVLPLFAIAGAPRRALSGVLRPYVLPDASGPILFKNWAVLVKCATWADVETWASYLGKVKYFIYHYHDPLHHNSYTQKVWVDAMDPPEVLGPSFTHIMLSIHLTDNSQT